jgi:hypothetical protein
MGKRRKTMKRKDFLKTTAGLFSLAAVPTSLAMKKPLAVLTPQDQQYANIANMRGLARIILKDRSRLISNINTEDEEVLFDIIENDGKLPPLELSKVVLQENRSNSSSKRRNIEDKRFLSMINGVCNDKPMKVVIASQGISMQAFNEAFKIVEEEVDVANIVMHPKMFQIVHDQYSKCIVDCILDVETHKEIIYGPLIVGFIFTAYVHVSDLMPEDEIYLLGEELGEMDSSVGDVNHGEVGWMSAAHNRISKIKVT